MIVIPTNSAYLPTMPSHVSISSPTIHQEPIVSVNPLLVSHERRWSVLGALEVDPAADEHSYPTSLLWPAALRDKLTRSEVDYFY